MNKVLMSRLFVWGLAAWLALALVITIYAAPPTQTGETWHTVQPGENLYRISLRYATTVDALMQANGITNPHMIYVGQQIRIPTAPLSPLPTPAPDPMPAPGDPGVQPGANIHIVQPGENLYRIGLKYGLTAQAIAWANGMANVNMVYVGQKLVIPAPGSAPVAPPPGAAPQPPSATGKQIVVVLSEQRLYAYENGKLVRTTLVSTGLPAYPTVRGTFSIYVKYISQLMYGPGYYLPNVPYVMYFYGGYSLHGTYWHNNFGQPMSHGCVNMPTPEAGWLYEWAPIGTPVTVRY